MERKRTNEIYVNTFDVAKQTGKSWSTRQKSFLWDEVLDITQSTLFPNCTVIYTKQTEFTINEHFDLVDSEWNAYLMREKLGITKDNE